MKRKYILGAVLLAACFLSSGCKAEEPLVSGSHPPVTLSSWVVSWDEDHGWKEYQKNQNMWDSLSYFAVTFDEKGHLHGPKSPVLQKINGARYLTFVNDVHPEKGKAIEKDTAVLRKVLGTEESRRQHVKDILTIAEEAGADGIEIDYERLAKDNDPELVKQFANFTQLLFLESISVHKKVRIILEPSMPMDLPYSSGPEYVVMVYNLYGLHSGPGPKADGAFIKKTIQKMAALPGKKGLAFSNGGCVWEDVGFFGLQKGKAKFITEETAVKLAKEHQAKPERDAASAALHFSYKEKDHTYEVWYADKETIEAWMTLAAKEGISSIYIWRLGGNVTLKNLGK